MEKKKFKMGPAITSELLRMSKDLPKVTQIDRDGRPRTRTVQVPGKRLKPEDLAPGQVLNHDLLYSVKEFVLVDHYMTMSELYKSGGMDVVNDYYNATMMLKKVSIDKLREKPSKLSRIVNWFKIAVASIFNGKNNGPVPNN
jgi:hypothetical protein